MRSTDLDRRFDETQGKGTNGDGGGGSLTSDAIRVPRLEKFTPAQISAYNRMKVDLIRID